MNTTMQELAEYAAIKTTVVVLKKRMAKIEDSLRPFVEKNGEVAGHGVRAYMKPGRKTTDHKQAAIDADVHPEIITLNTVQPAPRTSWANVTKQAGVDTSNYVTQAPAKFVIEAMK